MLLFFYTSLALLSIYLYSSIAYIIPLLSSLLILFLPSSHSSFLSLTLFVLFSFICRSTPSPREDDWPYLNFSNGYLMVIKQWGIYLLLLYLSSKFRRRVVYNNR